MILFKRKTNDDQNWILVLPPWNNMYHWQHYKSKLEWSCFFDLISLNKYTPVIEFTQFLKEETSVDQIFYLQNYKEGWSNGNFEEKYDFRDCNHDVSFDEDSVGLSVKKFNCVSFQGK